MTEGLENQEAVSIEKIASNLYHIVQRNLQSVGLDMDVSLELTQYIVTKGSNKEVDILDFIDLDNREFLNHIYISLLKRMPEKDCPYYEHLHIREYEFRHKLLNSVTKSDEFRDKGVVVTNNIYSCNKPISTFSVNNRFDKQTEILFKIYKKFPKFIRIFIRKIIGV